jgi:hypothetical protein
METYGTLQNPTYQFNTPTMQQIASHNIKPNASHLSHSPMLHIRQNKPSATINRYNNTPTQHEINVIVPWLHKKYDTHASTMTRKIIQVQNIHATDDLLIGEFNTPTFPMTCKITQMQILQLHSCRLYPIYYYAHLAL